MAKDSNESCNASKQSKRQQPLGTQEKQQDEIMLDRTRKDTSNNEKALPENDAAQKQQSSSALQEIQTAPTVVGGAEQGEKNNRVQAGNLSDEPVVETRPSKRTRRERNDASSSAQSSDEQHKVTAASSMGNDSAVHPPTTRRSSRTRQEKTDNAAAFAAKPSDRRTLRPRKQTSITAQQQAAKKPPAAHPGTSMKLRKRTTVQSAKHHSPRPQQHQGPMSDVYKEHRRNIDVGECEVCLHPYALSYLSKHRNKVHGLAHTTYGCPYCLDTFSSLETRIRHIQQKHKGQPTHWCLPVDGGGNQDLNKVKAHIYSCPLCPAHFTHSGLACHLGSSHHTSIDAFPGQIVCKCPFCMSSSEDGKPLSHFFTVEDLKEHVRKRHKGCMLLDDIKPPADRVFTRPGMNKKPSASAAPAAKKAPPPPQKESSDEEEEDWEQGEHDESSEDHWKRLDHNGLIKDYLYGDYMPVDFGMGTLSHTVKAVNEQLKDLEGTAGARDDDYVAEMKLYAKGLKDRNRMADAERIEKERHREEVERKLMRIQYENRNKSKKRSAEDIEYDAFLERPISFGLATRESARKPTCPFGDDCELCISHDEDPETDSSGQLIDAPSCHTNVVGDSLKAAVSSPEASDEGSRRSSRQRRGRRADSTTRSLLMIREMKHSLSFVAGYNAGYFQRT